MAALPVAVLPEGREVLVYQLQVSELDLFALEEALEAFLVKGYKGPLALERVVRFLDLLFDVRELQAKIVYARVQRALLPPLNKRLLLLVAVGGGWNQILDSHLHDLDLIALVVLLARDRLLSVALFVRAGLTELLRLI